MPTETRRDRLERLTNLMLVLLDTSRPLSLREITEQVEGYPANKETARQAFERDKRALRELRVPITNVPINAEEQVGYLVRAEDYFLPELGLDDSEAQALAFAVAAVQIGGSAGRDALSALGHPAGVHLDAPIAVLPSTPALGVVHEALSQRAVLRFEYRGRGREVEPYGLSFRQGAWYLVGQDRTAAEGGAVRTFRVDRFDSVPTLGIPGEFEVPGDLDLRSEVHLLPFEGGGEGLPLARVRVDGRLARQVAAVASEEAVVSLAAEGGVFHFPVSDEAAFVSWVLGLGDTAVVEEPAELRRSVVERLAAVATSEPRPETAPVLPPPETRTRGERAQRRGGPPGTVASERLRRLLALLVHLARVGEASIAELASRFQMSEDELVHDLELASCCGVPPYTPDQLIELIVDGDRVYAHGLGHLARPRRLSPEEGFALAAAAQALCEVSGAGEEAPLRSALAKLERALGRSHLVLDVPRPEYLGPLEEAVTAHESVEILYFSSAATEPTTRVVDPYQVVVREARWYLDGFCHSSRGVRRFQVDRVQQVRPTGSHFEPPSELDEALAGPEAFLGGPDTLRARIAFPASSALGVEQVAAGPLETLPDGRLAADVLVGDAEGWFARLLLRLGDGAEVIAPEQLRNLPARAALRVLERYDGITGEP